MTCGLLEGTMPKAQSMKKIIHKLDFVKNKNSVCKRHCQENEKTSHRLGENVWEKHIWQRTVRQNIHEYLKCNEKETNNPIKNSKRPEQMTR